MEDSGASHQKLLVARNKKRDKEIYRRVKFLPKKQKLHKVAGWQINV